MAKTPLTKDSEFIVGEEKWINYFLGTLLLALFAYGLMRLINKDFKKMDLETCVSVLAIVPCIYFFRRAASKRIYIRVNKNGIYQDERLVTNWENFIDAYISQKKKIFSIQDNFIMVVEFLKDSSTGIRRQIPLTNTQNKSEEDVFDAIKFFWHQYKNEKTA